MKMVIDIPEELYRQLIIKEDEVRHFCNPYKMAILDGKPIVKANHCRDCKYLSNNHCCIGYECVNDKKQFRTGTSHWKQKSAIVISQLRADRDRLLQAIGDIRAEIQVTIDEERTGNGNINKGVVIGLQMALDTIDKYKVESEESDADSD